MMTKVRATDSPWFIGVGENLPYRPGIKNRLMFQDVTG